MLTIFIQHVAIPIINILISVRVPGNFLKMVCQFLIYLDMVASQICIMPGDE